MTITTDDLSTPRAVAVGPTRATQAPGFSSPALAVLPGLAVATAIAVGAYLARRIPGMATFSPMILAILIGMAFHNIVGTPSIARPGIAFGMRRLLRIAIVLLGFQLTAAQIAAVGGRALLIVAATLVATFVFTVYAGRALGVDRKLTELIAAGTSICGASAIVATNTVTDGSDEDVTYAIACVTVFGSIAMFGYPVLQHLLHLDPRAYGLWSGASIHEIAQVVAAAFQNGQRAGELGTMTKLARVMLLAPTVLALSIKARLSPGSTRVRAVSPPVPWFVLGFIAVVAANSAISIPADARDVIATVTTFLLSVALAAMGLETDIVKLYARGFRPAILGAAAFLFIAAFSLTLIKLMG
ncbi:YeiH family protein [Bradyrhizobium sp. NP1]|uniref:YeiH family protein n=1 Tax=Bradyrhizobium sp. NP1 TaxID=3049772 RepID=UPI0025A64C88|nr:YeiH family protein [Bradyrhizobium sp. NP1]WJR75932.1 YeiH family protein [Bradyrhizobium sp. NP1]